MIKYLLLSLAGICFLGAGHIALMRSGAPPSPPEGLCSWTASRGCAPDLTTLEVLTAPLFLRCLTAYEQDYEDPFDHQTFALSMADEMCGELRTPPACRASGTQFQRLRNTIQSDIKCPSKDVCKFAGNACILDDVAFGELFRNLIQAKPFPERAAPAARQHAGRECKKQDGPLSCKMSSGVIARRVAEFIRNVRNLPVPA